MGLTIRRYACMGIHTNTYSAHGCPFNDQQESVKKKRAFLCGYWEKQGGAMTASITAA
jgi:hypothetical protein